MTAATAIWNLGFRIWDVRVWIEISNFDLGSGTYDVKLITFAGKEGRLPPAQLPALRPIDHRKGHLPRLPLVIKSTAIKRIAFSHYGNETD